LPALHKHYQFRLALCGHKAVEAGSVCLLLMVQGNLAAATLTHFGIASRTGLAAVLPALFVTFTRYARHLANRWTSSAFFAICTFIADSLMHESHYPGEYTEAALTALGAFSFSIVVSYTPIGRAIDRLAEHFLSEHSRAAAAGS
jgi:integral membrane sensor domain MASE1